MTGELVCSPTLTIVTAPAGIGKDGQPLSLPIYFGKAALLCGLDEDTAIPLMTFVAVMAMMRMTMAMTWIIVVVIPMILSFPAHVECLDPLEGRFGNIYRV
jgi:hypothetical protein